MKFCYSCNKIANIKRPKNNKPVCIDCFFTIIEDEIHYYIISSNMFKRNERLVLGASGGKDSTVLIHIMNKLNKKYDYGLNIQLLSIDEGIKGYRDDSLDTVYDNQKVYNLPLTVLSYKDLYNYSMDEIVQLIGKTNNCTFCGVFRRNALEKGAKQIQGDKIATGHNLDDIAETFLMNLLRGDSNRLQNQLQIEQGNQTNIIRVKPFKYTFEKEIVLYAYYKKLNYFSTECTYSTFAYRGTVRELIKKLELSNPQYILNIVHCQDQIKSSNLNKEFKNECLNCKQKTNTQYCKACLLIQQLNQLKMKQ